MRWQRFGLCLGLCCRSMAVHLTLSVLLIALLTGDIFCVPLGFYNSFTQGSSPAPVRSNVREGVHVLPQFHMPRPQNSPSAPSQPADTSVYMPEDPLNSPQPQGGPMFLPPVYPPPVFPQQKFEAGELYQMEETQDFGNFQRESNEPQLRPLPPLPPLPPFALPNSYSAPSYSGGVSYNSPYGGDGGLFGSWSRIPFDFNFLMGLYPKGTFTYQSSSFEQGGNHNNEIHYSNQRPLSQPRYPVLSDEMWIAHDEGGSDTRPISVEYP